MHPFLKLVALAALTSPALSFAQEVPVDLSTWQERGPPSNGVWTVAPDGNSVFQSINGDPTFFVSPTNQINTTIRGTIRVENGGDDDLVGFVLGFNGPGSTGNDMDFVLFDWKQGNQSSGGFTSFEGLALSRANGTITNYIPGFWGRTDSANFDNLATSYSATSGWALNTTYDFTILYQTNRVKIDLAGGAFGSGQTIFDVNGSFPDGAFGFYNYSQAGVRYAGLTTRVTPPPVTPIPEPETYALMLAGLAAVGAMARRRRARA